MSPIIKEGQFLNNEIYIKREDLLPFSFGGNKARKAQLFFDEIIKGNY
ncbi:MAG: 1-aminocyclopropane-1-carboxylate deaminase, partial [Bacillota bacterium]|nr:1-aminocyclopropane-1-carboxylate deaminase [Bacillota bacterium]